MDHETLKLAVPAFIAVLGWFIAHQFNAHRDLHNKRRELRVQFLLDAYRRLESAANRSPPSVEQRRAFESAVADIQLLGSVAQVAALNKFFEGYKHQGTALIDPVLEQLRQDLRSELGIKGIVNRATIFRFTDKQP